MYPFGPAASTTWIVQMAKVSIRDGVIRAFLDLYPGNTPTEAVAIATTEVRYLRQLVESFATIPTISPERK